MGGAELFDSKYFRLEALADGVYAAIAKPDEGGESSNAGIVDLGEFVLVFDAFTLPQAARDLLTAADRLIGKPVRFLINSHYHYDHILGNYVFPAETTVISTRPTREAIAEGTAPLLRELKEQIPPFLTMLEKQRDEAQDEATRQMAASRITRYGTLAQIIDEIVVRPPDITFEQRVVFHGSKRSVELLSYGIGHTSDDTILYLPGDRVIFMGDLLFIGMHPFLVDSDPDAWCTILEEIGKIDFGVAVPGHGPLGTQEDIMAVHTYIVALKKLAQKVVDEGGSVDDAAAANIPSAYAEWTGLAFPDNMRVLFTRLSEG